jgi:hypothetical protein
MVAKVHREFAMVFAPFGLLDIVLFFPSESNQKPNIKKSSTSPFMSN